MSNDITLLQSYSLAYFFIGFLSKKRKETYSSLTNQNTIEILKVIQIETIRTEM